ncbi:glycosyltransferase [Aquabacterium sp. A7-Y]|uniref:glycosyltransferase family 2 protein n=1 Tax=Aquabacterium sp. A7-Y TaxID=1349605 RepID=UPI00223D76F8|nr:glycosyltransferase [Aquabacterium sp. A7-Y]MCW7538471.1 glycosyltransferase [Aquabacterium sp. A7-Y]
MPTVPCDPRISLVVLSHNRCAELLRTLERLSALPEQLPVIVVDNGSRDGTAAEVARHFPRVQLVRNAENLGAAGRNAGVERVRTPYVAFCDDDCWWTPGALRHAADLLDTHPRVGALAARVLVGPQEREDPTCQLMAGSPLDARGLPGPALIGFMAGAVVMRTDAFRAAGGYLPRLFIGCEERLLGLDLAAQGWRMSYVPELVCHHHPSAQRDSARRRVLNARNTLWIAWLRLPWRSLVYETRRVWREAAGQGLLAPLLREALPGLPWALRHRSVLPPEVEAMRRAVLGGPSPRRRKPPLPARA